MGDNRDILPISEVALNIRCSKAHQREDNRRLPPGRNTNRPAQVGQSEFPGVVEGRE
jgi:hypothetical protein